MNPVLDAKLLEHGIAGVVILLLSYACQRMWRDNKALQDARIADLKAWQTQQLELTAQVITALTVSAKASEAQVHANEEVRETLKSFGDELRRRR